MAKDPDLNALNNAAGENPTAGHIPVEKIKSDNEVVGGVALGAIDDAVLTGQEQADQIESAVSNALIFKPARKVSPAVLSAANQLKKDFVGINQYVNARNTTVKQIDRLLPKSMSHAADRLKTTNAIIMERILGLRLQEAATIREKQLNLSANLLKFQTTTAMTYMRQSLTLQYRHLYTIKDLLTITKAFAEMAENKLEAIKINTKLPDAKKISIVDRAKSLIINKGLAFAGKHFVDILRKETPDDLKAHVEELKTKITEKLNKSKIGRTVLSKGVPVAKNVQSAIATATRGIRNRLPESMSGHAIWEKTKGFRGFVSGVLHKEPAPSNPETDNLNFMQKFLSELHQKEHTPESLLKDILKELKKPSKTPGDVPPSGVGMPSSMSPDGPTSSLDVVNELSKIMECVCELRGSFKDFKNIYEKNAAGLYDLVKNIDKSLSKKRNGQEPTKLIPKKNISSTTRDYKNDNSSSVIKDRRVPSNLVTQKANKITQTTEKVMGASFFGDLVGRNKKSIEPTIKKDIYDLVSVKLDNIYSLLDERIAKPVRAGSYQDHENREKQDEAKLLSEREDEVGGPSKRSGALGRLAKLLGLGGFADEQDDDNDGADPSTKPPSSGGLVSDVEHAATLGVEDVAGVTGAGYLGKKLLHRVPGYGAFKGLKKLGSGALSVSKKILGGGENVLKNILKIGGTGAKKSLLKDLLKMGGKSLVKKIPIIGALAGAGFAVDDAIHGDFVQAGGDAASGLVSTIPFFGTAGSVAIDSWLAYRQINKDLGNNVSPLYKARLKVYGVGINVKDTIDQLETRTLQMVVNNGKTPLTVTEVKSFAKMFGFDPNNAAQFQYFCSWVDNRFRNGYLTYIATIKKHGYTVTSPDDIKDADIPKILSDYTSACSSFLTKYSNIIPNLSAFRLLSAPANNNTTPMPTQEIAKALPGAKSGASNSLPLAPTVPGIVQAAYTVPAAYNQNQASVGQPNTYNTSNTSSSSGPQLSYTPSSGTTTPTANLSGLPTSPVGTGQCVALVEQVCQIGHTATWKRGPRVVGNQSIKPGTPIATFDQDGTYGNHTDGSSHAAIYLGPSQVYSGGIRVYDQWSGHAPSERNIRPQEALACNSANAFCVVLSGRASANNNTPPVFKSFNNASLPGSSPSQDQQNGVSFSAPSTGAFSGGFTSFNGAALPGASSGGGIAPSIAVQMAAARAGYVQQAADGNVGTVNSVPSVPISSAQTQQRAIQAVNYFVGQGWTKEQASGIVGSLIRESQLSTTAVGDGGNAMGIAQWHSDRYGPMLQALYPGKSVKDLTFEQQLAGIQWELNGPEKRAAQMLKSAKDPGTAGSYASKYYERPANTNSEMSLRAGLAQTVFNSLGSSPNSQIASTTSPTGQPSVPAMPTSSTPGVPSGSSASSGGGPSSNVISPVQSNVAAAENIQQQTAALTQPTPQTVGQPIQPIVQANFHPDVINAIKTQSGLAQKSLAALNNIHGAVSGVFNHLQQVHGPEGVFNTIADNTANSGGGGNTVIAPTILPQPNNNNSNDDVGFSVTKKRDVRYSV